MTITKITVSASSKLPHPNADYASMSSAVTIEASLGEEDNIVACTKKLQVQANNLVEQDLDAKRRHVASAKPQAATEQTADKLAEKHAREQ